MKKKPSENSPAAQRKRKNAADNAARAERNRRDIAVIGLSGSARPSKLLRLDARANRRLRAARTAAAIAALPKVGEKIAETGDAAAVAGGAMQGLTAAMNAPVE